MNYKIIADESELTHFIEWLPDLEKTEKYYVCLFSRKKYTDNPDIKNDKAQLKRFVSDKKRLLEKIQQLEIPIGRWKVKGNIEAPQESLALYISINPRCMKTATEFMGRKCWDLVKNQNYNIHSEAFNCVQKSKSRTCYIDFDIDDKNIEIDTLWLDNMIGQNSYSIIETRGGYHIMVKPQEATQHRRQVFNDKNWYNIIGKKYVVDQVGDQLIPIPGTFQGGFIPRFHKK